MFLYNLIISIKYSYTYSSKYKLQLLILYIIAIMSDVITLLPLYLFGRSVDYVISKDLEYVKKIIIYMIIIFFANSILSSIETYLSVNLNNRITYDIKTKLFGKIMNTTMSEYQKLKTGEYISRIEGDASVICKFIINDLSDFIIYIIDIVVSLYFILKISWKLSLIAIVIIPINFLFMFFLGKSIDTNTRKGKKISDAYFAYLNEVLNSYKEIKCLNIVQNVMNKYSSFINKSIKNTFIIKMITLIYNLVNQFISSISQWMILFYASLLIIGNKLTVGGYVAFNSYLGKFVSSIYKFSDFHISMKTLKISIERIEYINSLSYEETIEKMDNILFKSGNIIINNINFKYDNTNNYLLDRFSLKIKPNSLYGIVGLNGCGKSTLLNLICRLYKVNNGNIIIDGYNVNDISLNSLRNNIVYIQQDPFIFSGTIFENLAVLNHNAKIQDIKKACKMAHIDNYIESLSQKYSTRIGDGAMNLSGGQKQKLAIARAIISNRKIFLFDEITSGLDGESEEYILNTLNLLSKNKTIIVIAHRLTTLLQVDNIFVMNNGKLVGNGNHYELIEYCYEYKRLYGEHWNKYKNRNVVLK
ncbi:ABC transporter ATP-binding protein [Clostridium botulinum]|nr:ABC transporter ATP-binding protein [Clostridium botulinum]NFD33987.1 ABC transporter ATP-binding protein [Clostridium botulinum]NFD59093.1 ABC transporter ATP-binding protein [Clostridium botulinum]NFE02382.1 ABC transporter ATP-binding protein [Clostridium botulinum]